MICADYPALLYAGDNAGECVLNVNLLLDEIALWPNKNA